MLYVLVSMYVSTSVCMYWFELCITLCSDTRRNPSSGWPAGLFTFRCMEVSERYVRTCIHTHVAFCVYILLLCTANHVRLCSVVPICCAHGQPIHVPTWCTDYSCLHTLVY